MNRRRRFEETPAAETAPAAESGTESTPEEQIVKLLTEMGLSAEQATAVYQMAQDLAAGTPDEGNAKQTNVQASRQRMSREQIRRRVAMARARRERMSRTDDREEFGRKRKRPGSRMNYSAREQFGRSPLAERHPRRDRFSDEGRERFSDPTEARRRDFQSQLIRRQRQQLAEMRQQLEQLGQKPAARKLSSNVTAPEPLKVPTQGTTKDRVMNMLKGII